MTVTQTITVKNPPSRNYVAWATMPLPTGTDPRLIGNDRDALQQYRLIGRTQRWDIYKWSVLLPAGLGQVTLSDSFEPPQTKKVLAMDLPGGIGGGAHHPRVPRPLEAFFSGQTAILFGEQFFSLIIDGHNGLSETVPLAGPTLGKQIERGLLRLSWIRHYRTQNFGSFHIIWEATANDPYLRLTLNWHTGIPATELIFRSVRVQWPGGLVKWQAMMDDPAISSGTGYLVKPNEPDGHLFPRMAQRSFRLLVYPANEPFLNQTMDPGWGVADWSGGGYMATDLPIKPGMLDHISNLETHVLQEAIATEGALAEMNNGTDADIPDGQVLWPVIGQQYGGPTGSDSRYKPNNGIKALCSNRREGLLTHMVLQLRNHSRDWNAIYEPDGLPVLPELHLDTNGNAQWSATLGGGSPNLFEPEQGQPKDPYGLWKDEGFNFDQYRTYMVPPSGHRPYELQTSTGGILGNRQRWDSWDDQHRLLAYHDDMALAWLAADSLSILYLTLGAEVARMMHWSGPGNAQRHIVPASPALGQTWGRAVMWNMFVIANAAVFTIANSPLTDDEGGNINPLARRMLYLQNELAVFVQGTEKAMMPSGIAWMLIGGKPFGDVPFSSNYLLMQDFEVSYGMSALRACYGVFGNAWLSLLDPGTNVDINVLISDFARALDVLAWGTIVTVTGGAVNAGGSGYLTGETCFLVSDDHYLSGGSPIPTNSDAQLSLTAVAGVVTAVVAAAAGSYPMKPLAPVKTYSRVDTPSIAAAGSGYAVGQFFYVGDRTLAIKTNNVPQTLMVKVTAVNGSGGVTGISIQRTGRYFTPPTSPAPAFLDSGSSGGSGLQLAFVRSCGGNGLTVTPTWTDPAESGQGCWKEFPLGPYPGSTRYATRADFSPLDICNQSTLATPYSGAGAGSNTYERVSLMNSFGYFQFSGAAEAAALAAQAWSAGSVAAAVTAFKAAGLNVAGAPIENCWPFLAAFDP